MRTAPQDQAALPVARIERLHISPWHVKACLIMGTATFFDAFDVLAIAYVLPVLAGAWKLAPQHFGNLSHAFTRTGDWSRQRVASALGPAIVGFTISAYGTAGAFLLFGVISLAGAGVTMGATETRERALEEISP